MLRRIYIFVITISSDLIGSVLRHGWLLYIKSLFYKGFYFYLCNDQIGTKLKPTEKISEGVSIVFYRPRDHPGNSSLMMGLSLIVPVQAVLI